MKRLAIFDMDGTLVDSSQTVANAINYVRERLGLSPMPREQILEAVNNPHINPAKYFYEIEKFEPIHEEWFMDYYSRYHNQELRLFDGVEELLNSLKSRGCKIALATNAYRRSTQEALEHLNMQNIFDAIVCYDDLKRAKPYPDMLLHICNTLNIAPKDAIYIGDGMKDKLASESAGIDFIMVSWGYSKNSGEDVVVVSSVEELKKRLDIYCIK